MNTVYVVRHGETDWNKAGKYQGIEDIELNQEGEKQAHQLGRSLKGEHFDLIVSSHLQRAYKTALIIGEYVGIHKVQVVDGVHERDFGDASGLTKEERKERYPDQVIPGMEPWETFQERVVQGLVNVMNTYTNKKVIMVSHGGTINAILHKFSNGEIGTGVTKLNNTCVNILHFSNNQWQIEKFNCIKHLEIG
ncbi:histidine phosphatase family protein [Bacillus horti]|uniref:Phosphatase n=1 Tax=Caldalkalibacillus horti TaxID=77523 RepID=A0ABT9VXQ2_9BACI|nr:histidine phosphatase family protein [Bacillus horti]MDQ0165773.1 putative phosphatase [Bacillus horti]